MDASLVHEEGKSLGFPYVRQVDHYHKVYGSDHIPVGCVVWEANPEATPVEQEPVRVEPLTLPFTEELREAKELLRTTSAKQAEVEFKDPFLDPSFVPSLDDELLYKLDKELDDDRDFAASDVVACLQYRSDLQGSRATKRQDTFLKTVLRSARLIIATVPLLGAIINGHHIDILADSGASYSILSSSMVCRLLGREWRRSLVTTGFMPRFELADGRFSASVGRVTLPLRFRATDKAVRHSFFVLEAKGPMAILGVNFFMHTGAVLDFAKQRIVFRRLHRVKAVPFSIKQGADTARGAVCPVLLAHDVTLQPDQVADTLGYLEDVDPLFGSHATGMIGGCNEGLQRSSLLPDCITRFNKHGMAPIRLLNDRKQET